jgi:hypothetical protein
MPFHDPDIPMPIKNDQLKSYSFLQEMYEDKYYPTFLVDKCKTILVRLCEAIEAQKPTDNDSLLQLTHAARTNSMHWRTNSSRTIAISKPSLATPSAATSHLS